MSSSKNLSYQINMAVTNAFCPGESKRSAKIENEGKLTYKIYSYAEKDSMHEMGKSIARFIKKNYGIKKIEDVRCEHLQAWLDEKKYTSADTTMKKYLSGIRKLELICDYKYHNVITKTRINWNIEILTLPESHSKTSYKKDKVMPREVAEEIIVYMKSHGRKSDVWRSVSLSMLTGMRVEETSSARRDRFHFEPGINGEFGYVEIRKSDGSKGNRPRIIPITNKTDQMALKALVADRTGTELIIQNSISPGDKLKKRSITAGFERALKALKLDEYKGNLNHALRKDWAQRRFDEYRTKHTQAETIAYVNKILGHGTQRSTSELRTYCHNIY